MAPSQFELAPIFENVNIAADHNTLTMEVMKRVANRHGLTCLLNEKPFAGINGSGKHCNWSIANDKGENLLDPGTTPHQNLRFLAVMSVVMKAVHAHADALRASIASPGNDHRLGANEAPPAIISVFLGSMLDKILLSIEKGEVNQATEAQIINLGVSHIPDISKDYTDRNRTSPFAFTGNKFEFRAVGASANVAVPIAILNAAVADAFVEATVRLKNSLSKKTVRDEAVIELIRDLAKETRPVRFEGNNYSQQWQLEAKKRGLPMLPSSVEALGVFHDKKAMEFLVRTKVLTEQETASRYHISVERYNRVVEIELHTLREMVTDCVVPALEGQLIQSAQALAAMKTTTAKSLQQERLESLETVYAEILSGLKSLNTALAKAAAESDESKRMKLIAQICRAEAQGVRQASDAAELLVSDDRWPFPKYREMLFANTIS